MARKILILGESGTGKSTAAKNLRPEETFIICPDEKDLPFRGWKSNYKSTYKDNGKIDIQKTNFFKTTDPKVVQHLLKIISDELPSIKVILIDTITHLMIAEFMRTAKEKGYEKFTDMALDTYNVIKMIDNLREDLTVIITSHIENNYDTDGVLKSSFFVPGGKLLKEKISIEGMFTTVLYSEVVVEGDKRNYYFNTQNNGKNSCKSPDGMFEELRIPNDYKLVIETIEKYETNN